jgi:hypothetical protein
MKRIISLTESDLTRIVKRVIKEQNWFDIISQGWGPDVSPDFPDCLEYYSAKEICKKYFSKLKEKNQNNDSHVKTRSDDLRRSMEGPNLFSNNVVLDFFKDADYMTIASVINNWSTNVDNTTSLFDWIDGEASISWSDVMESIHKNPNIKSANLGVVECKRFKSKSTKT